MGKTHAVNTDDEGPQPDAIAWRVPVTTIVPMAFATSALMVWAFGVDWILASVLPFCVVLSATTVIDMRERRIPDMLTRPAAFAATPLLAISMLSDTADLSLLRALLGALAMATFYFLLLFINPGGMGLGDVKLAAIIGAQLGLFGWITVARGLVATQFIAGPIAILLWVTGRASGKTVFPFGPFMAAGAIVALVLEARGY